MALKKKDKEKNKEKKVKEKKTKVKAAPKTREKKVKNKKGQRVLKGARYVLFVGDEGTILLYMRNNVVLSRQFVPDASEQNLEELRASFNKDTKAAVSFVIDSIDQSYVKQSLPPVSSMSVNKLINRRLERDFGPDEIKGSLLLKRDETGRKDWNFLMISVERSRQISMWLEFAFSLENRFSGIFLASVETEIILKNLERASGVPKAGTGAKWKFFVSHNKVGGFRQVVLHNGRIVFTRMAQPIGESTPEVLAGNIEQEMQSTMEYMKRLAYNPDDGLDITIIAANNLKNVIDKNKFKFSSFTILSPYEVAQLLGIDGATQATDQFGDVILAASICSSPKHVLRLTTPESRRFDKLYSIFKLQRVSIFFLVVSLLIYGGWLAWDIYQKTLEAETLLISKRQRESSLIALKDEVLRSNLDIEKTGDIIELYSFLTGQKSSVPNFIAKVETVIKPPIVVKEIEWVLDNKGPNGTINPVSKITAVLKLQFASVPDAEAWALVSKKILSDLKLVFVGFDIQFTKVPVRLAGSEKMDLTFDSNPLKVPTPPPLKDSSDVELVLKEL